MFGLGSNELLILTAVITGYILPAIIAFARGNPKGINQPILWHKKSMIISKRFSAESQLYYRNVTFFVQTLPPQHKQKKPPIIINRGGFFVSGL